MARVTCRCGETLNITSTDPERVACPRCGAKIRLRRPPPVSNGTSSRNDGYVRFHCPCGRRLKVRVEGRPEAGKCPDCGRVVPVPTSAWEEAQGSVGETDQLWSGRAGPDARTRPDLDSADVEALGSMGRQASHRGPEKMAGQSKRPAPRRTRLRGQPQPGNRGRAIAFRCLDGSRPARLLALRHALAYERPRSAALAARPHPSDKAYRIQPFRPDAVPAHG